MLLENVAGLQGKKNLLVREVTDLKKEKLEKIIYLESSLSTQLKPSLNKPETTKTKLIHTNKSRPNS